MAGTHHPSAPGDEDRVNPLEHAVSLHGDGAVAAVGARPPRDHQPEMELHQGAIAQPSCVPSVVELPPKGVDWT